MIYHWTKKDNNLLPSVNDKVTLILVITSSGYGYCTQYNTLHQRIVIIASIYSLLPITRILFSYTHTAALDDGEVNGLMRTALGIGALNLQSSRLQDWADMEMVNHESYHNTNGSSPLLNISNEISNLPANGILDKSKSIVAFFDWGPTEIDQA